MARGTRIAVREVADRILVAYAAVGMRVSYSYMLRDQNRPAYEADEAFVRRLPPDLVPAIVMLLAGQTIPVADQMDLFRSLWETHGRNQGERVRMQLATANLHWCSDEALTALLDCSASYGVGLHMHLDETAFQRAYARKRTGMTAAQHLDRLGLLGPHLTLVHGVWLSASDIERIADRGTMVCTNPSSNLRLRSGIAPVNRCLAAGVRVGLGLDEAGLNDDRDMLQEMCLPLRIHRTPGVDNDVPTSADVFRMATEDGALTTPTPYDKRIGVLDVGCAADLVLMPWRPLAHPYLDPDTSVVDALVYRARPSAIDTVLVGGEVVLREGRITQVDKVAALEELAATLCRPPTEEDSQRRRVSRAIFPYLRQFYGLA